MLALLLRPASPVARCEVHLIRGLAAKRAVLAVVVVEVDVAARPLRAWLMRILATLTGCAGIRWPLCRSAAGGDRDARLFMERCPVQHTVEGRATRLQQALDRLDIAVLDGLEQGFEANGGDTAHPYRILRLAECGQARSRQMPQVRSGGRLPSARAWPTDGTRGRSALPMPCVQVRSPQYLRGALYALRSQHRGNHRSYRRFRDALAQHLRP